MSVKINFNQNTMKYVHIIIMLGLWFIIKSLPPFVGITEMGMAILGVTCALLYGWVTVDLVWPSLFGFVLLQLSGYTSIMGGLSAGFSNSSVIMVLILLTFAVGISQLGVSEMIAAWLIQRKIFINRPLVLVFGLLFGTLIISNAGGSIASIFLMWDLLNSIMKANDKPIDNTACGVLKAMILYNGMVGFILPWQNTIYLFGGFWQNGAPGVELPTMGVFFCGIIWAILVNFLMIFACKYILRIDFSGFLVTEEVMEQFKGTKPSIYQKTGLVGLIIYISLLLFGGIFKGNVLSNFINSFGIVGLSIVFITVFSIWKKPDGSSVLNLEDCLKQIPWSVIMLLAVTIPLASALQSTDTGIVNTITNFIYPFINGMNPVTFIIMCMVSMIIVTQFLHNAICGAIFLPILTPICISIGGDPQLLLFMCFISFMTAYATPISSVFSGLIFGEPTIKNKSAYLAGWLYVIVTIIVLVLLFPLWEAIFGVLY